MKCFITGKACEYKKFDRNSSTGPIFIICPFSMPYNGFYDSENGLVSKMLRKAKIAKDVKRADQALQLGFIICRRICSKIQQAKYILVDASLANANVYYEFGLSFGFEREIVICARNDRRNEYFEIIKNSAPSDAVIEYRSIKELLNPASYGKAFKKALSIDSDITKMVDDFENPRILLIVDPKSPVEGFYENAVTEVIKSDTWQVDRIQADVSLHLNLLAKKIKQAKICIIDTTQYDNEPNGIIYFSLGLAQALERSVIPITNTGFSNQIPFDIRGLWQIDFSSIYELKKGLEEMFPEIFEEFDQEKEEFPYRQLWNRFAEDRSIKIQNCCRNFGKTALPEARTLVDNWDYLTVSDITVFLPQLYPNARVEVSPTKIKMGQLNKQEKLEILNELSGDSSLILIGSADASDHTNEFLFEIYGFNQSAPRNFDKKNMFLFYKKHLKKSTTDKKLKERETPFCKISDGDCDYVLWYNQRHECRDPDPVSQKNGITYGVLTIAKYPSASNKWIMALSGFTGIATYGLIKLITNLPGENKQKSHHTQYEAMLERLEKYDNCQTANVNILVEIKYNNLKGKNKDSDNRELKKLKFLDIQPIIAGS